MRCGAGAEVEGDQRDGRNAAGDDKDGGAEAVRGGGSELLAGESVGAGGGDKDEDGEADCAADRRAGGGDA